MTDNIPVQAIKAPRTPLPTEAASASVTEIFIALSTATRAGGAMASELQYEHSLIINSMVAQIKLEKDVVSCALRFAKRRWRSEWCDGEAVEHQLHIDLINKLTQDGGVPYFLAPGNHDVSSADTHDAERRQPGLKNYYAANAELLPRDGSLRRLSDYPVFSFGYGNTFVLAFDSNIAGDEKQFAWVKAQLDGLDKRRYKSIIVYSHHPAFPLARTVAHTSRNRHKLFVIAICRSFASIVKIFFNGHEHMFEHWVERYEDSTGKHRLDHVLSGGGGAPLYAYAGDPDIRPYVKQYEAEKVSLERIAKPPAEPGGGAYHYVMVQVDGEDIKLEVVGLDWGRDFQPYRSNKASLNEK
ncbi:MAG: metallophosphoesterase [Blastocatellia bacterium]